MDIAKHAGCGLLLLVGALSALGFVEDDLKARSGLFPEKIAPLLQKHCISCHNPDKARGGLDLSTRAALMDGGDKGPVLVPGNAKQSRLYQMIAGPMPKMPRQAEPLPAEDVAHIGRWIEAGAPWPDGVTLAKKKTGDADETWWAFRPLLAPPLPKVNDPNWCKTPLDNFILAVLEAKGMRPSAPADAVTYLRRVKYDLHGLPPTPQEIDAFLRDCAAEPRPANGNLPDAAVLRLVERLLQSPHYGERWGRHWLDVVHYADTHGYDKDKRRLWAWLYRDWVIRAFNRDLPFRRFLRYQLAGDVLFPGNPDGVVATGFVVAGPWDFVGHVELREGTVDKEKTRALDRDDMVSNAIATFNSLTIHCARCHEHKFDPIPMKDYYQLQAVFAGVERGDRPVATQDVAEQRKALGIRQQVLTERRDKLLEQAKKVQSPALQRLDAELTALRKQAADLPPPLPQPPSKTNGYHSAIEKQRDVTKWVQVDLGRSVPIELIRLVPARPVDFPDTPGFGFPVRYQVVVSDDATFAKQQVVADQTKEDVPAPGDQAVSVPGGGVKARYVRVVADRLWLRTNDYIFALAELQVLAKPEGEPSGSLVNVARGAKVTALDSIEGGLWSTRHLVDGADSRKQLPNLNDPAVLKRLALETRLGTTERARHMLADSLLAPALKQDLLDATRELALLQQQLDGLKSSAQVYAVRPIPPRQIHMLIRGDVERKGGETAAGALTTIFPKLDHHFGAVRGAKPQAAEGERRAALARWLTDDDNALTWRSIVNRVWHFHFGKGLVDTPNDFGKNGGVPSHPELLDWLAADFRDRGDTFKRLHKMIVTSATYRQVSTHNPEYAKRDADNRFLWRMNRTRLDAESLRDSVLAVSGKLNPKMHGPGYDLFRFKDDHSPVYDHLDVSKSTHPDTWRRTVYRFVVRSVPNPFLETLDCADPNINVPVRNTTVTALQALALLNNPFMLQQSEFFAERVRAMESDPARQVEVAHRLAFGRTPTAEERTALTAYGQRHGLANLCRLLFNANEFLFVD